MSPKKMYTARQLRKNPTRSEAMMWEELRRKNFLGLKFRRQHPLAGFILDFYCSSLKLGIEIDGQVHLGPIAQKYDNARSQAIKEQNIILIRIKARAVENNVNGIIQKLKIIIKQLPPRQQRGGLGRGEQTVDCQIPRLRGE